MMLICPKTKSNLNINSKQVRAIMLLYKGTYTIRVFRYTSKEAMLLTVKNIPGMLGLSGK